MKFILTILIAGLMGFCTPKVEAAGVAGWNFQAWDGGGSYVNTTLSSLNFYQGTAGGFYDYSIGYVKWPGTTGASTTINFAIGYDDGHTLKANGVTVASGGCCQTNYGSYTAKGGDIVKLEFWSDNFGGGLYSAFVKWDLQGNGVYDFVTSTNIATDPTFWPPAYASSITTAQQNRVNSATSRLNAITKNAIYIDQVSSNTVVNIQQNTRNNQVDGVGTTNAAIQGTLNNITIRQGDTGSKLGNNLIDLAVTGSGSNTLNLNQGTDTNGNWTGADIGKHYQLVNVNGYSNSVTTQQQNTGGAIGNYLEANVTGNYNTVGITQTGGAVQKQVFSNVTGNNNTLNATQTGASGHYLDVSLSGNGNSAIVNQSNSGATGANYATISLVNAGGPASINLTQTGGQVYNILSTCVTVGGCATTTIKQGN